MTEPKKLTRDVRNGMIAGVFAGIAEYFALDPTLVRVVAVILTLLTAVVPMVAAYLIMWLIVPVKPDGPAPASI